MHRFRTRSEANEACFIPRLLAPLSIKPVEVSESSPGEGGTGCSAGQHCFPQPAPSFQRGSWKWLCQLLVSATAQITQLRGHSQTPSCPASKHQRGVPVIWSSFPALKKHWFTDAWIYLDTCTIQYFWLLYLVTWAACRYYFSQDTGACESLELRGRNWFTVSWHFWQPKGHY